MLIGIDGHAVRVRDCLVYALYCLRQNAPMSAGMAIEEARHAAWGICDGGTSARAGELVWAIKQACYELGVK